MPCTSTCISFEDRNTAKIEWKQHLLDINVLFFIWLGPFASDSPSITLLLLWLSFKFGKHLRQPMFFNVAKQKETFFKDACSCQC